MELLQGRPQDETGRPQKEIRTYDLLDSLGIPFVRVDHEVHNTMESCAQVDELLQIEICKNLFLCNRQETSFYLLMMPGEKPFKTKDLSRQLGVARLSFGKPEYMEQFLDITPGSVSVMGLMNDKEQRVQLLIDEKVIQNEYVGCHPCINTSTVNLSMEEVRKTLLPALGIVPLLVDLPDPRDEEA